MMTVLKSRKPAAPVLLALLWCLAAPGSVFASAVATTPSEHVQHGFKQAQACENEIDDDLTQYGECIGHAADRMPSKKLSLLGLNFQAWLIADLAARQGSTRSVQLRKKYHQSLKQGLRHSGWTVGKLCAEKKLSCAEIEARLKQKI